MICIRKNEIKNVATIIQNQRVTSSGVLTIKLSLFLRLLKSLVEKSFSV
jgi:hypothetical protein